MIHPWLIIEAFDIGGGNQINQVAVTGLIFRQQYQVVLVLILSRLAVMDGSGGNIDFTTKNRLDAFGLGCLVKVNDTKHCPMICDSHFLKALFHRCID